MHNAGKIITTIYSINHVILKFNFNPFVNYEIS
jgi:hypothetical protein